jgi:ribonuclease HI
MTNFYAVKSGIKPGIYLTWTECENNIKGFSKAKYKKFDSKIQAQNYINGNIVCIKQTIHNSHKISKSNGMQIVADNYDFEKCINVYTDGGCINNGSKNAIAGCGIYFKKDDVRNTSFKLEKTNNYKITNNRAELKAILHAISILEPEINKGETIVIHTDSKYSITSFTSDNLEKKVPSNVPNYDYVLAGNNICKAYPNIKFHHIKAHTGKQDIHSIGNGCADKLASPILNNDSLVNKYPILNVDSCDTIIKFGKYKNKSLEEIYQLDKEYLVWAMKNIKSHMQDIKLFMEKMNSVKKETDKLIAIKNI